MGDVSARHDGIEERQQTTDRWEARRAPTRPSSADNEELQLEMAGEALHHEGHSEPADAEKLMTPVDEFDTAWGEGCVREKRRRGDTLCGDHEKAKDRPGKGIRREGSTAHCLSVGEGGDQQHLLSTSGGLQRQGDEIPSTPTMSGARATREHQRRHPARVDTADGEQVQLEVEGEPFQHAEYPDATGTGRLMTSAGGFDRAWGEGWAREQRRRGETLHVDQPKAKGRPNVDICREGSAVHRLYAGEGGSQQHPLLTNGGLPTRRNEASTPTMSRASATREQKRKDAARGDAVFSPADGQNIQLEWESEALHHGAHPEAADAEKLMTPVNEFDAAWGEGWAQEKRRGRETRRVEVSMPWEPGDGEGDESQDVRGDTLKVPFYSSFFRCFSIQCWRFSV